MNANENKEFVRNANKPAFPFVIEYDKNVPDTYAPTGLTKREYFAAMAMQGLLSSKNPQYSDRTILAESAIIYADELLKQLNS